MNIVYLDILFLINLATDYVTLLCTARLSNAFIQRKSIILASCFGSVYACICTIEPNSWINLTITRLVSAIVMCLIAFHKETQLFRCCLTYLLISSIFGGILSPFVFSTPIGGHLILNIKIIILTFSILYFILSYQYRKSNKDSSRNYYSAEISLHDKSVTLTILRDTGNELYDPISNLPVLIIEQQLFHTLLPNHCSDMYNEDPFDLFCKLNSCALLAGRMRLIPCQSISGKDILIGVIPDKLSINGIQTEMIVAYTKNKLNVYNQYQGIC